MLTEKSSCVILEGVIKHKTKAAVLFEIDDVKGEWWIPCSCIASWEYVLGGVEEDDVSDVDVDEVVRLNVKKWFVRKEGIA